MLMVLPIGVINVIPKMIISNIGKTLFLIEFYRIFSKFSWAKKTMISLLNRSEAKLQVEISGSKENQIIYGEIQVK